MQMHKKREKKWSYLWTIILDSHIMYAFFQWINLCTYLSSSNIQLQICSIRNPFLYAMQDGLPHKSHKRIRKKDLERILSVQVLDILPATILHWKLIQFKKGILWSFTLKAFSNHIFKSWHVMYRLLQYNWVELISMK